MIEMIICCDFLVYFDVIYEIGNVWNEMCNIFSFIFSGYILWSSEVIFWFFSFGM